MTHAIVIPISIYMSATRIRGPRYNGESARRRRLKVAPSSPMFDALNAGTILENIKFGIAIFC
jgi:hypothetical protein